MKLFGFGLRIWEEAFRVRGFMYIPILGFKQARAMV